MEVRNNRQLILKELHIDESHNVWNTYIDNWYSVEAYRQQTGKLPNEIENDEVQVMIDFLRNKPLHFKLLKEKGIEFGSMYLSAKRFVYQFLK